jgi:hypothetical protein
MLTNAIWVRMWISPPPIAASSWSRVSIRISLSSRSSEAGAAIRRQPVAWNIWDTAPLAVVMARRYRPEFRPVAPRVTRSRAYRQAPFSVRTRQGRRPCPYRRLVARGRRNDPAGHRRRAQPTRPCPDAVSRRPRRSLRGTHPLEKLRFIDVADRDRHRALHRRHPTRPGHVRRLNAFRLHRIPVPGWRHTPIWMETVPRAPSTL